MTLLAVVFVIIQVAAQRNTIERETVRFKNLKEENYEPLEEALANISRNSYGKRYQDETNKYCNISCENGAEHTICKYKNQTSDFDDVFALLSEPSKRRILSSFNKMRNTFAGSNEYLLNLPMAANMREMVWNEELEMIAHRWTTQCKAYSDECRDIIFEGQQHSLYVSQLMHETNKTGVDVYTNAHEAVSSWNEGYRYLTIDRINPYQELPVDGIHNPNSFAQLVWADTFMVGCAMTLCRSKSRNVSRIVTACNFAPGGMISGKSVYKAGGPCSQCTKLYLNGTGGSFCSEEYNNLCAVQTTEGSQIQNPQPVYRTKIFQSVEDKKTSQEEREEKSNEIPRDNSDDVDRASCKYKCANSDETHTLCRYKRQAPNCTRSSFLIHNDDIQSILDMHNQLRELVASAWYTDNTPEKLKNFPKSSNMREMRWDKQLADSALAWAKQCTVGHDECRDLWLDGRRKFVLNVHEVPSQNLMRASQMYSSREWYTETEQPHIQTFFDEWIDEVSNFSKTTIQHYVESENVLTHHFVQLIWARTYMVGCAMVSWNIPKKPGYRTLFLVCNYAPRGNIDQQPIYLVGGPCAECEPLYARGDHGQKCGDKLPTLCQTQKITIERETVRFKVLKEEPLDGASANILRKSYEKRYQDETNKYCNIICENGAEHTMCKYKNETSDYDDVHALLNEASKRHILSSFNLMRNKFAGSNEYLLNLPMAANMREMVWNEELEMIAHRWSTQCKGYSDECRDIIFEDKPHSLYVSQLIHETNETGVDVYKNALKAFVSWSKGYRYLHIGRINPFRESPMDKIHNPNSFAQLVWAKTFMVGCAMTLCRSKSTNVSRIVTACNFAPGGMISGKSVYKAGGPCSQCTKLYLNGTGGSFCSEEYNNLCAVQNTKGSRILNPQPVYRKKILQSVEDTKTSQKERAEKSRRQRQTNCKYTCAKSDEIHTLCKYVGVADNCSSISNVGVDKETVLNLHNNLREKIASSWRTPEILKQFPKSSNMRELRWDDQLEESALTWAKQCTVGHDECRDLWLDGTRKFRVNKIEVHSQNCMRASQMYASRDYMSSDQQPDFRSFFNEWVDEAAKFNKTHISRYMKNENVESDHFVQLIWARTYMVGCAMVTWINAAKPGYKTLLLVCNYAPRGNIDQRAIYQRGGPCADCEALYEIGHKGRICGSNFPTLCQTSSTNAMEIDLELLSLILIVSRTINLKLLYCQFFQLTIAQFKLLRIYCLI
ncbi:hypothetical protein GE061_012150 [Apolygus lucorum]|uniref:SCP domain-containing protein n=1 Tax=Apolygus lucorum TaxID=248454 RepID=A0A8S9XRS7_APOLU|nr:hypothetical protein GE061_012150 [Apolygus lucorum]